MPRVGRLNFLAAPSPRANGVIPGGYTQSIEPPYPDLGRSNGSRFRSGKLAMRPPGRSLFRTHSEEVMCVGRSDGARDRCR